MTYIKWVEDFNNTLIKYCPYFEKLKEDNEFLVFLYNKNIDPELAFSMWYNGIPQDYTF